MARKTIEICTHVYCPPGLDYYAEHLRFQVASFYHWPPKNCDVVLTVCYTSTDISTRRVREDVQRYLDRLPHNVKVQFWDLQPKHLFRRAIGRNQSALHTTADIWHATDVDYFWGEGCLDSVAELLDRESKFAMPVYISICQDHATGDRIVDEQREAMWPKADLDLFVRRKQKIAIGGVQWMGGDLARKIGYCNGTKWVEPVDPSLGFRSCKCDKAFRSTNKAHFERLAFDGVYRLRHTRDGRDYTLKGENRGREAW